MPYALDFATLPPDAMFESRSLLLGLPKSLEARLVQLPQVLERVRSASRFADVSSKQEESWLAAAYLRAALADYCSIEEMQKVDRPSATHLRISGLANPLFHLLELMRHLNVHVKSVQAERHTVEASFREQSFDLDVQIVSNLDVQDLAALKNGKNYTPADLQRMVDWFQRVQVHWGAGYVVRFGIESLAELLCSHYRLCVRSRMIPH
ncbi:hypothetical protein [Methyloversatilis discipulorum]|uniref:hypothetical protein n=1 Tax=Methyloversatilis discipulorum TaxID=1119528 RepID=UPI001A4F9002|nr:hypothetical protein [Methyloversatilis discipulorum]MBL8466288.1 hypothetical protein [Methyloversatilis discipulorum]